MSVLTWLGSTLFGTCAFWVWFGGCVVGCVDQPLPDPPPQARIVTSWDPLACGEPHRVVVELEDEDGLAVSASAPCSVGGLTLDVLRWGVYLGRVYAWSFGPEIRSVLPVRLDVDEPLVHWRFETPR